MDIVLRWWLESGNLKWWPHIDDATYRTFWNLMTGEHLA